MRTVICDECPFKGLDSMEDVICGNGYDITSNYGRSALKLTIVDEGGKEEPFYYYSQNCKLKSITFLDDSFLIPREI